MNILKAIGAFFARIGRWIRDTAWVQPLLIVGGIFAIIFSIPYIVDAVESNFEGGNEAVSYFEKYKLSLEGSKEGKSEADDLFNYLDDRSHKKDVDAKQTEKYGNQFFVTFVDSNCESCKETYPGFQTMESKFGKESFVSVDVNGKENGHEFKLFTIFIDEKMKEEDKDLDGSQTAFSKYFVDNHSNFFDMAVEAVRERPYAINNGGTETGAYATSLEGISDLSKFTVPTTFMIDFSFPETKDDQLFGITDILFNFTGKDNDNSSYGLARTLMDCWNHQGDFAIIK